MVVNIQDQQLIAADRDWCEVVNINQAKIKIIFVSPYQTDPKKLPQPPKKLLQFFIQDYFFFIIVNYREAKISGIRRIHCLIMLSMIAF